MFLRELLLKYGKLYRKFLESGGLKNPINKCQRDVAEKKCYQDIVIGYKRSISNLAIIHSMSKYILIVDFY